MKKYAVLYAGNRKTVKGGLTLEDADRLQAELSKKGIITVVREEFYFGK